MSKNEIKKFFLILALFANSLTAHADDLIRGNDVYCSNLQINLTPNYDLSLAYLLTTQDVLPGHSSDELIEIQRIAEQSIHANQFTNLKSVVEQYGHAGIEGNKAWLHQFSQLFEEIKKSDFFQSSLKPEIDSFVETVKQHWLNENTYSHAYGDVACAIAEKTFKRQFSGQYNFSILSPRIFSAWSYVEKLNGKPHLSIGGDLFVRGDSGAALVSVLTLVHEVAHSVLHKLSSHTFDISRLNKGEAVMELAVDHTVTTCIESIDLRDKNWWQQCQALVEEKGASFTHGAPERSELRYHLFDRWIDYIKGNSNIKGFFQNL